jgi:response regulator RpfG family c-di-GMP phosphodiesterase
METETRPRVLCVDDDPNVLQGLKLHLRRLYRVDTAPDGAAGLHEIETNGAPAVVLSDMRMPGMDGAAFLGRVRQLAPETIRVLLTGQADVGSCITAINEGQIFRFLTKPCAPDMLMETVRAAVEQHRLVTSERVLLDETLRGSIKALIDVLSLSNPMAFGRASRIKQSASELAAAANLKTNWQIEVAAMLSHIGWITLPQTAIEKLYYGSALNNEELKMTERLPEMAAQLIAHIPRLEDVRAILVCQNWHFDGGGRPLSGPVRTAIPVGARILKIVNDFDYLEAQGLSPSVILDTVRSRHGWYDPDLLETFCKMRGTPCETTEIRELQLKQVKVGMVFEEDVRTPGGTLLIARGYEVTHSLVQRIANFSGEIARLSVRVIVRTSPERNIEAGVTS